MIPALLDVVSIHALVRVRRRIALIVKRNIQFQSTHS